MNDTSGSFSVLMSLYYKEDPVYLDSCFASLANQSLLPTEIVCVFDGPLNADLENVVLKWSEKLNVNIVRLPVNVGLGNALNKGLAHCSFDIVARMDSDDICLPERFQKQIPLFFSDKDLILLGSGIDEFEVCENTIKSVRKVPLSQAEIRESCKIKNPFNHMTVVFRKNKILSLGGYQHHFLMEDYNLWLRVIAKGYKVENVDSSLVKARVGNGMVGRRKGIKYIKSEWELFMLKKKLGFQSFIPGICVFLMRSVPRLLPKTMLSMLYNISRAKN
ncbi:glycosyltransferase [Enterobacter sp. LM3]|uniref:glycosyltransferase n=1 Tax=Enterobacter sp. LM3 TaxID=3384450 RepID=UPI003987F55A